MANIVFGLEPFRFVNSNEDIMMMYSKKSTLPKKLWVSPKSFSVMTRVADFSKDEKTEVI